MSSSSGARRSTRRALDEALAGLGRPRAGGFRHPVRDLDRRRQRHPGAERGRRRAAARCSAWTPCPGLGAVDLPQDEWGVDVVVAGSQKSLMCPPGLAFASVSERAMALAAREPAGPLLPRLGAHRGGPAARSRRTPRSRPAVTLFRALDVALDLIVRGGPRARVRAPRAARPRRAGRGRGARPGALRARRRQRQRRHGRRACPTTSTAPRCRS